MTAPSSRATAPFLLVDPGTEALYAGRYKVGDLLGVGSMGTVHLAVDARTGARVALKRMSPELARGHAGDQLRERFRREALVLSKLRHENVVRLLDYGALPGDNYYLAMEYVTGGTLLDFLEMEDALHPWVVRDIGVQLCHAIQEVHKLGVIHRDLKPENIMLQPDESHDSEYSIRLCDFGIAQLGAELVTRKLTHAGAMLGTVLYMSPEQAHGLRIDHTSDIYAVGCLLFEMLTGEPPFFEASMLDIIYAHATSPLPKLDCPDMDPFQRSDWHALLSYATAKTPENRPPTALEFAELLRRLPVDPPTGDDADGSGNEDLGMLKDFIVPRNCHH